MSWMPVFSKMWFSSSDRCSVDGINLFKVRRHIMNHWSNLSMLVFASWIKLASLLAMGYALVLPDLLSMTFCNPLGGHRIRFNEAMVNLQERTYTANRPILRIFSDRKPYCLLQAFTVRIKSQVASKGAREHVTSCLSAKKYLFCARLVYPTPFSS